MFTAAGLVVAALTVLTTVDDHFDRIRLGRRVGITCPAIVGTVMALDRAAFAKGADRHVSEEAAAVTRWFTYSIHHVFDSPGVRDPTRAPTVSRTNSQSAETPECQRLQQREAEQQ